MVHRHNFLNYSSLARLPSSWDLCKSVPPVEMSKNASALFLCLHYLRCRGLEIRSASSRLSVRPAGLVRYFWRPRGVVGLDKFALGGSGCSFSKYEFWASTLCSRIVTMIEHAMQILTENQSDAEDTKTRIHTPPYFEGVVTTPNYCRCVSASNSGVRSGDTYFLLQWWVPER